MSKDKKANPGAPVAPAECCPVESCKKPMKRMNFCDEHFSWFKEGLVNKRGDKPSDFDKKYQAYMRKKAA